MASKRIIEKHGLSNNIAYGCWHNMKARCYSSSYPNFKNWGGRGIVVCERWLHSFAAFLEDMGERPSKKHWIDRIDNDGNYEPGNCRWATPKEQLNNTRFNVKVLGRPAHEVAAEVGVTVSAICSRRELGWSDERIASTPKLDGSQKIIDLTGKTFGRWTVLSMAPKHPTRRGARWLCRCNCGNEKVVEGSFLRRGESTSCGCFQREELSRRNRRA